MNVGMEQRIEALKDKAAEWRRENSSAMAPGAPQDQMDEAINLAAECEQMSAELGSPIQEVGGTPEQQAQCSVWKNLAFKEGRPMQIGDVIVGDAKGEQFLGHIAGLESNHAVVQFGGYRPFSIFQTRLIPHGTGRWKVYFNSKSDTIDGRGD